MVLRLVRRTTAGRLPSSGKKLMTYRQITLKHQLVVIPATDKCSPETGLMPPLAEEQLPLKLRYLSLDL